MQDSGNRISKLNVSIKGTQHIILGGKVIIQRECTLQGDVQPLASSAAGDTSTIAISIGRYTVFSPSVTIHPPTKLVKG